MGDWVWINNRNETQGNQGKITHRIKSILSSRESFEVNVFKVNEFLGTLSLWAFENISSYILNSILVSWTNFIRNYTFVNQ